MRFKGISGLGKEKDKNFTMDGKQMITMLHYEKPVSSMKDLSPQEQEVLLERYVELLHRISLIRNRIEETFDPVVFKSCSDRLLNINP